MRRYGNNLRIGSDFGVFQPKAIAVSGFQKNICIHFLVRERENRFKKMVFALTKQNTMLNMKKIINRLPFCDQIYFFEKKRIVQFLIKTSIRFF